MKNAITNYENTFYFDKTALSGVISVDGSYNLSYSPLNSIGKGFFQQSISSAPTANLSVSRYLTSDDPVLNSTGLYSVARPTSAGLYYKNKYFAFEEGYLSSMNISCSVGEIPTIEAAFDIYGDIGPNFNPSGDKYAGSVFIPQVKNIILSTRNSTTNRVVGFGVDYSMPKIPIYGFGRNNQVIEVHNVFPIEVTSNFILEVDDYESKAAFDDLSSNGETSFSIDIKASILNDIPLTDAEGNQIQDAQGGGYDSQEKGDDPSIFSFGATNAVIVSEQVSSTSDDVMSVNLSYKTYLN